jgi:hypothetical protein
MLAWLGHDPLFDVLRGDRRFQSLLKRLNISWIEPPR